MSNTPLTFRYPSYSEYYFDRKKALEEQLKNELKTLSDMQPFYERCMSILRKHHFTNEVKIEQHSKFIFWRIILNPSNSIHLLKPLIEDFQASFNKKPLPHFSNWSDEVSWTFRDDDWRTIELKAYLPATGLVDVSILKVPRATISRTNEYECINPWWTME